MKLSLSHGLYMAEQEGLLNTRESAIQNIIKEVKNYPEYEIPALVFYTICEKYGIKAGSLTKTEMARIDKALKG